MNLLETVTTLLNEVNSTNSTNEKIEILQKYPQCKDFLKLLLDPLQTTGVTRKQIMKYEDNKPAKKKKIENATPLTDDLTTLVQNLYTRTYSGYRACEAVLHLIKLNPEYRETVLRIAEKNLKWRMDVKQINKAFPGLIATFEVALAQDFEKDASKKYFEKNKKKKWFISRKFDGVRVLTLLLGPNNIKAYSRNGNEFPALANMVNLLTPHFTAPVVLDGEICCVDEHGNESFVDSVSKVKQKSTVMEDFRYYIFDMLTLDEFNANESKRTLSQRMPALQAFVAKLSPQHFRVVEQVPYTPEIFETMKQQSGQLGWEGLMLRLDTEYKGKRSNDILKVKNFYTEEYEVQDIETGVLRVIDPTTKLEIEEEMLKSVIILHKNEQVNVGSGFSIADRRRFFKHPKEIIGKKITVRYFEESRDSEGKVSLRFPTFKYIWEGEDRDV